MRCIHAMQVGCLKEPLVDASQQRKDCMHVRPMLVYVASSYPLDRQPEAALEGSYLAGQATYNPTGTRPRATSRSFDVHLAWALISLSPAGAGTLQAVGTSSLNRS